MTAPPALLVAAALALGGCLSATAPEPLSGGCEGAAYPDPATSPYVLPVEVGTTVQMGLTNCSRSFHGAGEPDRFAYDFDVPVGTPLLASRAGTVSVVVEDAPSDGGGAGNYVGVDHGDGTTALYYHSPRDGIDVAVGDAVEQGGRLGVTGRSGLAGYPHLHLIVVEGDLAYPYTGMPITFSNVRPRGRQPLATGATYTAAPY